MNIYLAQHGEALAKDVDPDRPLSDGGRADVRRIAGFLASSVQVSRVVHSGKTRARQSAEIMAAGLGSVPSIEAISGIAPNDSVDAFARQLAQLSENHLVVGHLPFMAKLVGRLAANDPGLSVVQYQPGSIVSLASAEDGQWRIEWMLTPALLQQPQQGEA